MVACALLRRDASLGAPSSHVASRGGRAWQRCRSAQPRSQLARHVRVDSASLLPLRSTALICARASGAKVRGARHGTTGVRRRTRPHRVCVLAPPLAWRHPTFPFDLFPTSEQTLEEPGSAIGGSTTDKPVVAVLTPRPMHGAPPRRAVTVFSPHLPAEVATAIERPAATGEARHCRSFTEIERRGRGRTTHRPLFRDPLVEARTTAHETGNGK